MKNKYEHPPYDSMSIRGIIAIEYILDEEYDKCYDLLTNTEMHLRTKDLPLLATAALVIDDYNTCICCLSELQKDLNVDWKDYNKEYLLYLLLAFTAQKILNDANCLIESYNNISTVTIEGFFNIAESHFYASKWFDAAHFYLLAALSSPNNDIYWGYLGQALLRDTSSSLREKKFLQPTIMLAKYATQKAIDLNPNKPLWRINMIIILLDLHLLTSLSFRSRILNELNIVKNLDISEESDMECIYGIEKNVKRLFGTTNL